MAKPRKKRRLLFAIEIMVLLLFIGGLYLYGQVITRLEKIEQPVIEEEKILVNEQVLTDMEEKKLTGFTTYALFGIDHRDKNASLGGENSDTMIIASVNNDTKDIRLASVYRDTLLNIDTNSDTFSKANAAYAYGGPEQAISMLNTNLDLNITDYATIDFNALVTAIDCLGGLDVPLSYAEIVHMNNYCVETSEETGKSYTPVELPDPKPENEEEILGKYHLNGVQATSYCRIRYTSSLDMGRTARQRLVIQLIVQKAKKAGLTSIFKIMDEVFPMVKTSLNKTEILQMIPTLIGYSLDDTTGFPSAYKFANVRGSVIVATDLETNVIELHKFLYGDDAYEVSDRVKERSKKIIDIVGGMDNIVDVAPVVPETDEPQDDFIWQNNGTDWEYTAPEDTYTPPEEDTYTPPEDTYTPPEDTYTPPEDTYTPPEDTYTPPEDTYTPPEDTYTPPEDTYTPPEDTYSEPQSENVVSTEAEIANVNDGTEVSVEAEVTE